MGNKENTKGADQKLKSAVKKWGDKAADELVVKGKDGKAASAGPKSYAKKDSV